MTAVSHAMSAEPDDDPASPGPPIDRFDMEIVEFMVSWAPYGGPPREECVPLFGMSRDRLLARLGAIVAHRERRHLGEADLALLERAAGIIEVKSVKVVDSPLGRRVLRNGVWRWT